MNYRLSHTLTQATALFHLVNQFLMSEPKFTAEKYGCISRITVCLGGFFEVISQTGEQFIDRHQQEHEIGINYAL